MKFKLNALVAALALIASAGANATISAVNSAPAGSSVLFVAYDAATNATFTADLGLQMTDFLQASTGTVFSAGSLAYTGTPVSATWTLGSNSSSLGGTYAWSSQWQSFLSTASSNYTWGVIAADGVTSTTASATNTVKAQALFSTANSATTEAQLTTTSGFTSARVATAVGNFTNFAVASAGATTVSQSHSTDANGASLYVGSTGAGNLYTSMKANYGQVSYNYLDVVGATQSVLLGLQSGAVVWSLGTSYGVDTLQSAADAATFTFDGTTLSYQVAAVPEASTLAMLLAGLGAVGFIARRRKSA